MTHLPSVAYWASLILLALVCWLALVALSAHTLGYWAERGRRRARREHQAPPRHRQTDETLIMEMRPGRYGRVPAQGGQR